MSTRKNAIWMAMYEIFIYICPLITAPYIARVLGTYGTGVYSYTYSIVSYFVVLTQLGVNLYGRREIASCLNLEERSKTFWGIWIIETGMFLLSSVAYVVFLLIYDTDMKTAFLIQYLTLLGAWLDISWLYFGVENFKVAVSRNIIVKVFSLFAVFIFVKEPSDVNIYVFIMAFTNTISVVVMWITVGRYISLISIKTEMLKKHFIPLLKMFIPVLSTQLFSMTDKVFLGVMTSVDAVGIYENAYKISRVPVALITTIGTVLLPKMTKLNAEGKEKESLRYFDKSLSITLFIGIGCAFGLIGVANPFIPLYLGDRFKGAIIILQLLSLVLIAISFGNAFRTLFILPRKMDNLYLKSVLLAALTNIVLNTLLIPRWGAIGAAIASVLAEFLICVYQTYKIREYFNIPKLLRKNVKYLLSGGLMLGVLFGVSPLLHWNVLIVLGAQIMLGGITYLITSIGFERFCKEEEVLTEILNIVNSLRKRKKGN